MLLEVRCFADTVEFQTVQAISHNTHFGVNIYRSDIDGIRALSVISVIGFHLNLSWASNGYLGVDIFFVISGYLIIGGLLKTVDWGSKSKSEKYNYRAFYFRRVRRIIPVATVVLLSVLLFSYFFTNTLKFNSIYEDFKWSAAFLANFHFARVGSDYFESGFSSSPLLHIWSLSIEEQFYLIFPVSLFVVWGLLQRFPKWAAGKSSAKIKLLWILISVCVISFSYNLYLLNTDSVKGYFSSFGRIWEIIVGGIVFMVCELIYPNRKGSKEIVWISLCVILSLLALWWTDQTVAMKQLLVVYAVSVYLISLPHLSFLKSFLSVKPLVFVGKISYSLYLWHWPVVVFTLDYVSSSIQHLIVSMCLMLILSILTWRFVELPFRKIQPPKSWGEK